MYGDCSLLFSNNSENETILTCWSAADGYEGEKIDYRYQKTLLNLMEQISKCDLNVSYCGDEDNYQSENSSDGGTVWQIIFGFKESDEIEIIGYSIDDPILLSILNLIKNEFQFEDHFFDYWI